MNTFVIILLIIVGLLLLLMIAALFMTRKHFVRREIIINVPRQKAFDYLRFLKNQDAFNEHATRGDERIKEFKGTDGTVGFIYAWKGNKQAGEGEKEIMNLVEGQRIESEIRFIKPMAVKSSVVMELESIGENQTKVSWSNSGFLKYPLNIMIPLFEKKMPKPMDASLLKLKNILEN